MKHPLSIAELRARFPRDFVWGAATSAFQIGMSWVSISCSIASPFPPLRSHMKKESRRTGGSGSSASWASAAVGIANTARAVRNSTAG